MSKGDVVLVPFPFDDLSTTKVRPTVCLTDPIGPHRHVVLAFISSQVPPSIDDTEILLDPADPDFTTTGLKVPSVLRLHRLMTVTDSMIVRHMGRLTPRLQTEVATRLARVFGL